MPVRGIRGATTLSADTPEEMREAVSELLRTMMLENRIDAVDIASILFTATPDIHSIFPATAARDLELAEVPLICAQELDIHGALSSAVRVLIHVNTDLPQSAMKHQFLRGASVLRPDISSAK